MEKRMVAAVVVLISLILLQVWLIKQLSDDCNKKVDRVGSKFVYEGDTVTVIDYSLINSTYTLSNGIEVHQALVLNQ